MKHFNISPLDPRVRDLQAEKKISLPDALLAIKMQDIKDWLRKGGETVCVTVALVEIIDTIIQDKE